MISNDGQRIADAVMFTGILTSIPLMLLLVTVYTSLYIGWTALIGIGTFVLFIPFQVCFEDKFCVTEKISQIRGLKVMFFFVFFTVKLKYAYICMNVYL